MHRRSLLRRAAALAFWPMLPTAVRGAWAENAPIRRVRPADPEWPGEASWAKLNETAVAGSSEVNSLLSACRAAPDGQHAAISSKS